MSALIPGAETVERESVSAVGTTIAQIFAFIRNIISYILEYLRKILEWMGNHPLASILFITNMSILVFG